MNLTQVEFTVLRFATDAIIGEPAKYEQILRRAEKHFPESRPFKQAIDHLRKEMKTVNLSDTPTVELEKIAKKLLEPERRKLAKIKASGSAKDSKVAKKPIKAALRSADLKNTRHLAGSALKASLHPTNLAR